MSYSRNWLHCVWGTKNRTQFLTPEIRREIIKHIRTYAGTKGICIDSINGYSDHIRCLLLLQGDHTLEFVIQMIRGESSYWINRNELTTAKFDWEEEYYATSVSHSHISSVREYIKSQEKLHFIKSWEDEFDELMEQWGLAVLRS